ncbi:hypothetical protein JCM11641_006884 [Rhodosporidiobolus odoratus]
MPRSKSISSDLPFHTPSSLSGPSTSFHYAGAPPSPSKTRVLSKASSFADLRLAKQKFLKRLKGSKGNDLDFGCSGDLDAGEIEEEDEEMSGGDQTLQVRSPTIRPSLPSAPPSFTVAPGRPAPYKFPLTGPPSVDELRRLARQKDEELAAEACLDYMSSHSHARKHSRSSSLVQADTTGLGPAIERLSLRRGSVQQGPGELDSNERPRSGSTDVSSVCSSRPRTNDSLPSFAESASTVDSTGPPSPITSPSLKGRPTLTGAYHQAKADAEIAHQPRAYAFI